MNTRLIRSLVHWSSAPTIVPGWLWRLLLIFCLAGLQGLAFGQSINVTLQIPLERSSHSFEIIQKDASDVWVSLSVTNQGIIYLVTDENGNPVPTASSYLEATASVLPDKDYYLVDSTTSERTAVRIYGTPSHGQYSFLNTTWLSGTSAGSYFFVVLASERYGHSFSIYDSGNVYPLTNGVIGYTDTGVGNYYFGFFEAWSATSPTGDFRLVDHTAGQISGVHPNSDRNFTGSDWTSMPNGLPTVSVKIHLDAADRYNSYEIHSASGSLGWLTPVEGTPSEDTGWEENSVLQFTVGAQQNFWITRVVDGWTYNGPGGIVDRTINLIGQAPYLPRLTILLPEAEAANAYEIVLPNGGTVPLPPASVGDVRDDWGISLGTFAVYERTVILGSVFKLRRQADGMSASHTVSGSAVVNWSSNFPPILAPPALTTVYLQLPASRWNHSLAVYSEQTGLLYAIESDQMQGFWSTDPRGAGWFSSYYFYSATAQIPNQGAWWVVDQTLNETASAYGADLSTWYASDSNLDTDGDTLVNWYEELMGLNPNTNDSDHDGASDSGELSNGSNPTDPTSGGVDTDGDGMYDYWEYWQGLNPNVNDAAGDLDLDGLTNLQEHDLGTFPSSWDSDTDGYSDGVEYYAGTDPKDMQYWPVIVTHVYANKTSISELGSFSFTIAKGLPVQLAENVTVHLSGTAVQGEDYTAQWGSETTFTVTIPAGQTTLNLLVQGKMDFESGEATKTLMMSIIGAAGMFGSNDALVEIQDATDLDTDGDGMLDVWELLYGLDPGVDDRDLDKDSDGLTNWDEYSLYNTAPNEPDTDGDTFIDSVEVQQGTNPTDSSSKPDQSVTLSANTSIAVEGTGFTYTVTRNAASTLPLEVNFSFWSSATLDVDYSVTWPGQPPILQGGWLVGKVTIPAGADSVSISGPVAYDVFSENGEGVSMQLDPGNGYSVSNGVVSVEFVDSTVDTDGDGLYDHLEIAYGLNPYDANDATADQDADGLIGREEVSHGTNALNNDTDGDGYWDGAEVQAGTSPTNPGSFPGPSTPVLSIQSDVSEVNEGSSFYLTIHRTGDSVGALTVDYVASGTATPGSDHTLAGFTGQFTIPANESSITVQVTAVSDLTGESDEVATFTLVVGGGVTGPSVSVTIRDYMDLPSVSIASLVSEVYEQPYGGATDAFVFTRTGDTSGWLTVGYSLSGDVDWYDFNSLTGFVTFAPGQSSVNLSVAAVNGDYDQWNEYMTLTLQSDQGPTYVIGSPSAASIWIIDQP